MSDEEVQAPNPAASEGNGAVRPPPNRPTSQGNGAAAHPSWRAQAARDIPLPLPFRNDGSESFQLWARRYEVIQAARYRDADVNLDSVMALELPTRLPPELFIVWDNLPPVTRNSFASTKKHLQDVFGRKDIIASFQAFPNSRSRKPGEAMEVYAADVCRLVKEAFPDFEPNAAEYMKLTRFLAGLDQELQIKCHERGVKTFQEAFDIATQAERARQAAKLLPPPVANSGGATAPSVNIISESPVSLHKVVQDLTDTVRHLNKDLTDLKLTLNAQTLRPRQNTHSPTRARRSPSPSGRSPGRSTSAQMARSFSPTGRRQSSPDPYHKYPARYGHDSRRQDYSEHRSRDRAFSPRRFETPRESHYYRFSPDRHADYYDDMSRPHYERQSGDIRHRRNSPSPVRKRVSFRDNQSGGQQHHHDFVNQDGYQQGNYR